MALNFTLPLNHSQCFDTDLTAPPYIQTTPVIQTSCMLPRTAPLLVEAVFLMQSCCNTTDHAVWHYSNGTYILADPSGGASPNDIGYYLNTDDCQYAYCSVTSEAAGSEFIDCVHQFFPDLPAGCIHGEDTDTSTTKSAAERFGLNRMGFCFGLMFELGLASFIAL
jgi:hypothetical protein